MTIIYMININNWVDNMFKGITSSYDGKGTIALLPPFLEVLKINFFGLIHDDMNVPNFECKFLPGINQLKRISFELWLNLRN